MKYTDFYKTLKHIQHVEKLELLKAIQAHGGKYEWDDSNDNIEMPYVAVRENYGPADACICSISLVGGRLNIRARNIDTGELMDLDADEIMPGEIGYIINLIKPTDKVEDVSTYDGGLYTLDEVVDIQFLTLYASRNENWELIGANVMDKCRRMGLAFAKIEPQDWGDAPMDFESAINLFLSKGGDTNVKYPWQN